MTNNEWQQISGDIHASQYGAMFGQLDVIGDTVYGVRVVEVINMVDACGSDWDTMREHGELVTESHYVDVDHLGTLNSSFDWRKARSILDSHDSWPEHCEDSVLPEDVREQVVWCEQRAQELQQLARWEQRAMTKAEVESSYTAHQEAHTARQWYALPRMERARMAASYGGYAYGQSLTFATLREAMEYHNIPASALWHESEYNAGSVVLHNVDGIAVKSGTDEQDNQWTEFEVDYFAEQEDGECCMCGRTISSGWLCLDGGDEVCSSHVTLA